MEKTQSKKQQIVTYKYRNGITIAADILTDSQLLKEQKAALCLTAEKAEFKAAAEAVKDMIFTWLQMKPEEAEAAAAIAHDTVIARAKAAAETMVTSVDGKESLFAPVRKARKAKAEAAAEAEALRAMLTGGKIADRFFKATAEAEAVKAAEAEAAKAVKAVKAAYGKDMYSAVRLQAEAAEATAKVETVKTIAAAAAVKAAYKSAVDTHAEAVKAEAEASKAAAELLKEIAEAEAAAITPAVKAEAEKAAEAVWVKYECFYCVPHLYNNDGSLKSEKAYKQEYAEKIAGVALAYGYNKPEPQFSVCSVKDDTTGKVMPGRLLLRLNARPQLNESDDKLAAEAYAEAYAIAAKAKAAEAAAALKATK